MFCSLPYGTHTHTQLDTSNNFCFPISLFLLRFSIHFTILLNENTTEDSQHLNGETCTTTPDGGKNIKQQMDTTSNFQAQGI